MRTEHMGHVRARKMGKCAELRSVMGEEDRDKEGVGGWEEGHGGWWWLGFRSVRVGD